MNPLMNALMPGEHDYLRGKPMPGQVAQAPTPMQQQPAQRMMQPQQSEPAKRGGFLGSVGNALSTVFKYGAPEAFEQGRQMKARDTVGNALAGGDYESAAQAALKAGNIDQGLKIRTAGTEQQAAQRQQEAQGVLQLFTTLEPGQVAQYAMEDPQGFERMTGMSADEFTQAGARMRQMGVTPEQFTQMVVQKAQAELGVKPAEKKPFESKTDAFGRPLAFDPNTGEYGDPFGGVKGEETNGIIYDPLTYERKADFQTPSQTGEMTDFQRQSLAIERDKADAAAAAANVQEPLDFGEIYRVREGNEKRFQAFETAQRNFLTMSELAQDGTGAADVALGFAFFKTIDPTSTVREGEFAQAATAMGLGGQVVSMFQRLDNGQKFTPQLRQELVNAAGRAYQQQAQDIEALSQREETFARQMNVDPSLVTRNPVRSPQKSRPSGPPPQAAIQDLMSDPSPEAVAEFNEIFGEGAAESAMQSLMQGIR